MSQANYPVTLADYSELTLEVPPVQPVTQELVLSRLVDMQYQLAGAREVKRPVRNEDRVVLDVYALIDDVPVPGTVQPDLRSLVRDDMLVPGFARLLLGMLPGQKKDMRLPLPQNSESGALAGQTVTFRVHLKQLFELQVPELDDHFPRRTGKAETLPELFKVVAQELHEEFLADWKQFITQTLIDAVVDASEVELPQALIATELESTWNRSEGEALQRLGLNEVSLQQALAAWQASPELRQGAEKRLKTTLVLHAIAEQEQLSVTPDDLALVLDPFCQRFQQSLQEVYQELVATQQLDSLVLQIETEKAADFLFNQARLIYEGQLVTA